MENTVVVESPQEKIAGFIQSLFDSSPLFQRGKNGNLPKLFYVGPIILWLVLVLVWKTIPDTATSKANPNALANNLQSDINMISEKAEDSKVLDMTKKEMIQADKKASFIGNKMRQKLEKSEVAKSDGQFDNQKMSFDSALNRTVHAPLSHQTPTAFKEEVENTDDLSYVMDEIKKKRKSQYDNRPTNNPNYGNVATQTEAERKGQLAQAAAENRRRRAEIDQTQTEIQAQAYEKAIQDNEARYRHFYGLDQNGQPLKSNTNKKTKPKNEKLSFSTTLGAKDNLKLAQKQEIRVNDRTFQKPVRRGVAQYGEPKWEPEKLKAMVAPANQIPFIGVIDQAQKIKSGDKVQIRITEDAWYQGLFIPQNTILYGIAKLNQDRIKISVPSIHLEGDVYPAQLTIYDPDGLKGIYVDGTFNDWTKDAIQEGLSAGNSLGIQNALGNFSLKLGRKANNRARVYVPSGYQVFLYDLSNANF